MYRMYFLVTFYRWKGVVFLPVSLANALHLTSSLISIIKSSSEERVV